jgi:hypothetical protein
MKRSKQSLAKKYAISAWLLLVGAFLWGDSVYLVQAGSCTDPLATCEASCTSGQISMEYCGAPNRCCKTPPVVIDNQTAAVANPLGFNTVQGVFDTLLGSLQAIIVVLAMIAIVIGGILYITAGGDEGRLKTAKGAITAALVGLALGIAAPSFLKQIGDILGWGSHRSTRSQNSLRYCP